MIPPAIVQLRIADEYGRRFGFWLPVFLLWPFALVLLLVVLPFLVIAEIVLTLMNAGFHPMLAVMSLCSVVSALRGTRVHVASPRNGRLVKVLIS